MYLSSSYDSKKSDSTDDSRNTGSTSSSFTNAKFLFPPAPRLCKSANNTSCSVSCQSDSSASDGQIIKHKKRNRKRQSRSLPPIGVFWDIENCQVPKNKSAATIVQRIREIFFGGYREAEFIVVCDVRKENPQVIQDLHDAQVNLIHVSSTSKNAADEKLRQSLRRFADTHLAPATVVLISGDVNFAADLSDLRYRKKIHVILVHNTNVADALILCANETFTYASITDNLPLLKNKTSECVDLFITNLPKNYEKKPLKNRLKYLSDNCGGRVIDVDNDIGLAILRFTSLDFAIRAQRRLNGEDVFGRKIVVSNSGDWRSHNSPRNYGRKTTNRREDYQTFNSSPSYSDNPVYNQTATNKESSWRSFREKSQKPALVLQEPNIFSCPLNQKEQQFRGHRRESFNRSRTPHDETQGVPAFRNSIAAREKINAKFQASNTFQPIVQNQFSTPIELVITNLDPSLKDAGYILTNLLKEHAMAYSLSITNQADGTPVAKIKVGSQQDAQNIISKLHHHKFGFKRLSVAYAQTESLDPSQLKEMVVTVLQESPLNCMPLYRLLHLLEERFLMNVSASEIYKLRDVCRIIDESGETIVALTPEVISSPPSNMQRTQTLYCTVHCPNGIEGLGWGSVDEPEIPQIKMPLKVFTAKLHTLLSSHLGTLPFLSFAICYQHEFGETLPIDNSGVPLEHLVTCVNNIQLKYGGPNRNAKYIVRDLTLNPKEGERDETFMKSLSPTITSNISLLSRELVDLLKTTDRCQLQFHKYIPAYHHHFGRQLRVAQYGYTKLSELLLSPAISNIIQILGEGNKRIITLTHSTQMRRFTSDLLRVLKSQPSKELTITEFPAAYERVLNKAFNSCEYGLCCLEDLLDEISENSVVITKGEDVTLTIPKREQTPDEILRTKQFAEEVVKLLSYSPQCSILFNKFVPAYHHHYRHQCKVSDYGFTKLIDLFESIPETVKVEELSHGERKVSLTLEKALKLRGNQISDLVRKSPLSYLPLESLPLAFQTEYGYALKPQFYDCNNVFELVSKLDDFVKVNYSSAGPLLFPIDHDTKFTLALRVWAILINPPHHLKLTDLINLYNNKYQSNITLANLEQLNNVIINRSSVMNSTIFLTPPYVTAAKLYFLLFKEGGQVPYTALDKLYRKNYGVALLQSDKDTYEKLLTDFSFLVIMRRTRKITNISLNPKLAEYGLLLPTPASLGNDVEKMEEATNWPPPPNELVYHDTNRRKSPPKPDTPCKTEASPARGIFSNFYKQLENSPEFNVEEFFVSLPEMEPHPYFTSPDLLISPVKYLLSPPLPEELPMPDKLLAKGVSSDDSADSGVNNYFTSENEIDISNEHNGVKLKNINSKVSYLSYEM